MSDRPDAAGARARRRGLGWALAALLSGWTLAGDARAERFVLSSGEVVEGTIVAATRNTVVVRRSIGGMRQMASEDIAEVRFDLAEGQVAGEFVRWADGVYELAVGDEVIRLGEGGIVSRAPRQTAAQARESRSAPGGQQQIAVATANSHAPEPTVAPEAEDPATAATPGESEPAADAQSTRAAGSEGEAAVPAQARATDPESQAAATAKGEAATDAEALAGDAAASVGEMAAPDAQTRAAVVPEREAGIGAPSDDESAAAGEQAGLAADAGDLTVKASVEPPAPGERNMVFKIELSEPAAQTVVLIYGTVDDTAKAGRDYEARQGMVTLAPGERGAEVRVPLLGGEARDGEKRFELVLMGDPKVAEILDPRVIATIKGVD